MSFLIGLSAGLFGGLVGLGGGVLMIPMMVGLLKLTQHQAHGTSLVALVFTGIAGALVYAYHNQVDVPSALLLAVSALWPARFGARCCHLLPEGRLRQAFGCFQIVIAAFLFVRPYLAPLGGGQADVWLKAAILVATGVLTGFISGLMGIGGGAIMVASMVLLAGYGQHLAQGSALLAMVPAGATGAFVHWRMGHVALRSLGGLIPGVILGALAGGAIAQYFPETVLRVIFAAVLLGMGTRLIIQRPRSICE